MKRIFDTAVQEIKYQVLREVASATYNELGVEALMEIPKKITDSRDELMRCCVYKERAIVGERVKIALGQKDDEIIKVIDIACDECPASSYQVGPDCRGCLAQRCRNICPRDAITIVNHKAVIDTDKCVNCGKCATVCPYSAISKSTRPCERACKIGAISMGETKCAEIDYSKCISCGACVYQCPFGAIQDKSYITDVIKMMKVAKLDGNKMYAVVAPSISSQFTYANVGQAVTGIKEYGFDIVVEAALGADMVAYKEAQELAEKGFLTSSCCPAFVEYVEKFFPDMKDKVSHNLSPMAEIAKYIKRLDPDCKVVFIGPCTAKKKERLKPEVSQYIDAVLTFEELQALFDSRDIDITSLEEGSLDNASFFGRIFARSGGLAMAVEKALETRGITKEQFELKAISCDGIEECKLALMKASRNVLPNNFIEGMACVNGCIGGAACLTHEPKDKNEVNKYAELAKEKDLDQTINIMKFAK